MAEEGGEQALLAMIGADPKQLAEAGELDSPRNSTGWVGQCWWWWRWNMVKIMTQSNMLRRDLDSPRNSTGWWWSRRWQWRLQWPRWWWWHKATWWGMRRKSRQNRIYGSFRMFWDLSYLDKSKVLPSTAKSWSLHRNDAITEEFDRFLQKRVEAVEKKDWDRWKAACAQFQGQTLNLCPVWEKLRY